MRLDLRVVSNGSKILIWKQITTTSSRTFSSSCCFQWFKDTNLKANHNSGGVRKRDKRVVSNGSKILIWKQITTHPMCSSIQNGCFQWFKDTNLKANHNNNGPSVGWLSVVSNGSKILIWKQITTRGWLPYAVSGCFQWFKDTNLKANHNSVCYGRTVRIVVSNGSKILIWKQITT